MSDLGNIRPFSIAVSDGDLDTLSAKLATARLPDELDLPLDQAWEWGIPLAVLKPIVEHWQTQYDWRAVEENLNRTVPQFIAQIDSRVHGLQEVHFVHKRSDHPNATPLLFVHGWPGNFLEVSKMLEGLANPANPKHPSFHVVAPSIPGYVFSQRASTPGMDVKETAFVFDKLMAKLGYRHYLAQGGDLGSRVCRGLAMFHQGSCLGTHANLISYGLPSFWRNPLVSLKVMLGHIGLPGGYTTDEMKGLERAHEFSRTGGAYRTLQGTRPQTLAVALTDSPVGLLAWIGEKMYAWTDNYPWTPEELITWTMLYWINGPAGGLRYYKENKVLERENRIGPIADIEFGWSPTPFGYSYFPREIAPLPVDWAGLRQNVIYTNQHNKGGHFAAWEVPDLLMNDIREFARLVLMRELRLSTSL